MPHPHFEQFCEKHYQGMFSVARSVVENELEGEGSEEIWRRRRAWRYALMAKKWTLSEDETVQAMKERAAAQGDTTLNERLWIDRVMAGKPVESVVYFLRHGDQIKIGTSVDVRQRVQHLSLPQENLLATEPGGLEREHELHEQWAPAHAHGEWFWAVPALLAYIDELNAKQPAGPVDSGHPVEA